MKVIEEVATAVQEESCETVQCREISRTLDRPVRTVRKILRNFLYCYPYKISHLQQLFFSDLTASETSALEFLTRMEVVKEWPWKILWTDEDHFHLTGYDNTQNCQIWATENPPEFQPVPLHPAQVTVGRGFRHHLSEGHIFSRRQIALGPVFVTVSLTL